MANAATSGKHELNTPWLVGTAVAGLLLVGSAIAVSLMSDWEVIWSSLLLEVGASIMLISAVFLAERRFVERATTEIKETLARPVGECRLDEPYSPLYLVLSQEGDVLYRCGHDPAHAFSAEGARKAAPA